MICPGFVADCLETLEEIAMEGKAAFLASGGKEYPLHPGAERGASAGSPRWPRSSSATSAAGRRRRRPTRSALAPRPGSARARRPLLKPANAA